MVNFSLEASSRTLDHARFLYEKASLAPFLIVRITTMYFDYQSTTPVADHVLKEMRPHFSEAFANPHSSDHALGWRSATAVEAAAQRVAELIGSDSDEIFFTSGATESNNLAILGLGRRAGLRGSSKTRILLSAIEHKCVLSAGRALQDQYGFVVDIIPVDHKGHIVVSELERLMDDDVLLVSIMAVNNEIGTIQDIQKLSEVVRKHGSIFHCDAAQAPLAISVADFASHVDMLSLSGHKMYGPKGIGALYINRELQEEIEPLVYGGGQQKGIRPGTLPTPLCVGLASASDYVSSPEASHKREELRTLRDRFLNKLLALPYSARLFGAELENRHPGNISIGFEGLNAQDILCALQPRLAASTGSACTSGIPEPSHVLKAIGLTTEEAESAIRFSLGFETTEKEVDNAVELLEHALLRLTNSLSTTLSTA